ncbi:hypothetical protein Pcinc_005863 [Petrolisthes cinctipes]|uniref:Uncharacterized protein n=1 Tax=Petrolisthes cinctipes TaxID=88211 RepID=A0AAE1GDZ8_PETCI|nr:hypothetical protein Pcinc_005863 [Petrolisthes cinctipes]
MALPTPPLQDIPGHMALPTPPLQDTDEYYTDELEMNSLLINNLKIQLYLTHLLNTDQQQNKKRGRKARRYYLLVDHAIFNVILLRITPRISRQDTNWRKALEPGQSLAITLRFMATGEAYKSMTLNFYVGANSISKLVPDTCEAIKR